MPRANEVDRDDLARRAAAAVDDRELVRLLQQMVRIRSYSAGGEEDEIARFVQRHVTELGLDADLHEVQPGRFNVLSRWRGTGGGRSLMFNGHLDTNPAGNGWSRDPLAGDVDDRYIYGIGVSNMKAADAAYIAAVRAVRDAGIRLRGDVILAHVIGELQGGVGTLNLLERGVRADRFVVGEPTDLSLLLLHAGSVELEVVTFGATRHLSKMEEGVDAIEKMLAVMARLRRMPFSGPNRPDYEGLRRLAIGTIRGGIGPEYHDWRPSLLADRCSIKVAVRYGPGQTPDSVLADVRREIATLEQADPTLRAEARLNPARAGISMGPFEVASDADIVQVVRRAHRDVVGQEPQIGAVPPYKFYGTDAAHLARAGMVGLVYGPGGKFNTMPDERVELTELFHAARVYASAIVQTCA
ncbi:MAG: M20/M25/M40 family metallo-hydrolase [Candidatus Rokubacteria bacterium]|nr:M20/M25/M40 family metallo-hydrolase [Candidatus Rokubacteria bacterium]